MKKSDVTYEELRELLLDLGCSEARDSKRLAFTHPALGTFLLFRLYGPEENVNARDMVVVRRQLIDNGLIEESAFDRFMQKASA
ncbi:MAG: hypothetical protein L0215_26245 [Gemmataceae bacterium]|nr:hypothetical protein [Gemmataceae bacterium]